MMALARLFFPPVDGPLAPAELEALLLRHLEVADVAVVGVVSKEEATQLPR